MTLSHDTLSFLLTYLLHSSLLLGAVWCLLRTKLVRAPSLEDALWNVGLLGGRVTASAQIGLGVQPLGGRLELTPPAAAERRAPADHSLVQRALTRPDGSSSMTHLAWLASTPAGTQRPANDARAQRSRTPSTARSNPALLAEPAVLDALVTTPQRAHFVSLQAAESPVEDSPLSNSVEPRSALAASSWIDICVVLWLAVASLGLLRFGRARQRLGRALERRQPVRDPHLLAILDRLQNAGHMRRVVRLSVSPLLAGPVAMSGEIVLPRRVLSQLDARQQEAVLAHELGHIVRRDPLWLQVCAVLQALFFFQPLNQLGRRRLQETSEFLCDDWAVSRTGQRLVLAQCLAQVAGWVTDKRAPALLAGMVRKDSSFVRRVERLAGAGVVRRSLRPAHAALLSLTVISLVSCSVPSFSWGDDDEPSLLTRFVAALEGALNSAQDESRDTPDAELTVEPVEPVEPVELADVRRPSAPVVPMRLRRPGARVDDPVVIKRDMLPRSQVRVARAPRTHDTQRTVTWVTSHDPRAAHDPRADDAVILRLDNGQLIDATRGNRGIAKLRDDGSLSVSTAGEVHIDDGVLTITDEGGRTLLIIQLGDEGQARSDARHDHDHDDHTHAHAPDSGHDGRDADQRSQAAEREMERSMQAMEREFEAAERELQRAMEALERDFDREMEAALHAYEHHMSEFEHAHELEYEGLERAHEEDLSELEAELDEYLERAPDDQLDDEWLEQWDQAFEELNASFEESLELVDAAFEREYESLEAAYEEEFETHETEFEDGFAQFEAEYELFEAEFEFAFDAMFEEFELAFDRDCDHDCETRCDGGCTHPEPDSECESEPEPAPEPREVESSSDLVVSATR